MKVGDRIVAVGDEAVAGLSEEKVQTHTPDTHTQILLNMLFKVKMIQ